MAVSGYSLTWMVFDIFSPFCVEVIMYFPGVRFMLSCYSFFIGVLSYNTPLMMNVTFYPAPAVCLLDFMIFTVYWVFVQLDFCIVFIYLNTNVFDLNPYKRSFNSAS